ncbi:hypothetical protein [Natronococcus sp. A-GB7]|uniref:hypothetical protein n=1 Tax=Natronococcus sp. A-GB7 TaxID=3037649 RepID=UPI00241FE323|nr:hypothetical protein [Natronococcus sp. A-GB7]MDG5821552.1 hypothetical protein [Natronococcus sp. A-GB7]
MKKTHYKAIAAFLVAAGAIQTVLALLQDTSFFTAMTVFGGVAFATAGVAFWFEI